MTSKKKAAQNYNYPESQILLTLDETRSDLNFLEKSPDDSETKILNSLTEIPDKKFKKFIKDLSSMMISEVHYILEWYTKSVQFLSENSPEYFADLSSILHNSEKTIYSKFEKNLKQKTCEQINFFKDEFINKNLENCLKKNTIFSELNFGKQFRGEMTTKEKFCEIDDQLNYDYKKILERLEKKREKYPNLVQEKNFSHCQKQLDFDNLHKDSINIIDICPNSKLLAAGSSDGVISFIDLETLNPFPEITMKDPEGYAIKSIALDNKNNVAWVNEKNVLRIFSLLSQKNIAKYQGENLVDYTDSIPAEVIQFTGNYCYLAFRSSSKKILLFDMATRNIQKEFTYDEKIIDYSISKNLEYIALVGYYGSYTKIKDCVTDEVVCEYKFDFPIHAVQCSSDNSTIIYGLGNGLIAHMKYDEDSKSLCCVRMIGNQFKVGTDVSSISVSIDSRFIVCGSAIGDYAVKIWDLHEGKIVQDFVGLHSYNVKSVKISRNSRFVATGAEDSTYKLMVFNQFG